MVEKLDEATAQHVDKIKQQMPEILGQPTFKQLTLGQLTSERLGGFSTTLKYGDLLKLRKVCRNVHFKNYPTEFLSDYECDKMIDVMAPETQAYLIEKHFKELA